MSSFQTAQLNQLISPQTAKLFLDDGDIAMIVRHTGSAAAATVEPGIGKTRNTIPSVPKPPLTRAGWPAKARDSASNATD